MPIFEYKCRDCEQEFEALVLPGRGGALCPGCGSDKLEQQISGFAASSEGTQTANLAGEHRRVGTVRKDHAHETHKENHRHFDEV